MSTFKQDLQDWTDVDWAAFKLACHLGLMEDGDFQVKAKHVFYSNNDRIGEALGVILEELYHAGVLEQHLEEPQYRWNPNFKGSWEK
jgi:hypothetical protein